MTQVRLPLNHPPVVVACSYAPGMAQETRYWQKNISDDGVFFVHIRPGQVAPPSCDKGMPQLDQPLVVTCTVYPGFMVKGLHQEGDEGDAGTSIVPMRPGQAAPACDDKTAPGEFLLAGTDQSGAGFWGAVNGYVFLSEPDGDLYGANGTVIYRADAAQPIVTLPLADAPGNRLSHVPGGFDLRLMTQQEKNCAVGGNAGAACLARLEQAAGVKIPLAQCVKAEPANDPHDPVAMEYPALLSVRGGHATLRAAGPATRCIPSE